MTAIRDAGLPAPVSVTFRTVGAVQRRYVPSWVRRIVVEGYYEPGDGGGGEYLLVSSEPTHDGKIFSGDGRWWELDEDEADVRMFGAIGDVVHLTGMSITGGLSTLTSASAAFTSSMVGKLIVVEQAGELDDDEVQRQPLRSTILSVNSTGTQAILADDAGNTVSAAKAAIGTDATVGVSRALKYAIAKGATLHFRKQFYWRNVDDAHAISMAAGESLTIRGHDGGGLFLDMILGETCIYAHSTVLTSDRCELVDIQGLTVRGTYDYCKFEAYDPSAPAVAQSVQWCVIRSTKRVVFRDNVVEYVRGMGFISRNCLWAEVENNTLRYVANDGISVQQTDRWLVADNRVEYADDDGIAIHAQPLYNETRAPHGGVCTRNYLLGSQGISGGGLRHSIISHNILEFCRSVGIQVGTAAHGSHDGISTNGVLIEGNLVVNHLDRGEMFDDFNTAGTCIRVYADAADDGSENAIPGDNDSVAGAIVDLYDYLDYRGEPGTDPIPPTFDVMIRDNTLTRTAKVGEDYSALHSGEVYGGLWDPDQDPELTLAMLSVNGIELKGDRLRNIVIDGNTIRGILNGVTFNYGSDNDAPNVFTDVLVARNTFVDLREPAVETNIYNGTTKYKVKLVENEVDLDPQHSHPERLSTGGWTADDDLYGFDVGSGTETFIMERNTFRNVSSPTASGQDNLAGGYGNVLECDPDQVGSSDDNIGIRRCPQPSDRWQYRIKDCDPSSANWGKITNACQLVVAEMPTSGKWIAGQRVKLSPATAVGGGYLTEYLRLTTGTGHSLGTDWVALYAPTYAERIDRELTIDHEAVEVIDTSSMGGHVRFVSFCGNNATSHYFLGTYDPDADESSASIAIGSAVVVYTDSGSGDLVAGSTPGTASRINVQFLNGEIRIKNLIAATHGIKLTVW